MRLRSVSIGREEILGVEKQLIVIRSGKNVENSLSCYLQKEVGACLVYVVKYHITRIRNNCLKCLACEVDLASLKLCYKRIRRKLATTLHTAVIVRSEDKLEV